MDVHYLYILLKTFTNILCGVIVSFFRQLYAPSVSNIVVLKLSIVFRTIKGH